MFDKNVAIYLRDGAKTISANIAALADVILLSIVTRAELEAFRDVAGLEMLTW